MRYVTDLQLDQLIVHIVDPSRSNGLVLSERTCPLEGNRRLVDYFVAHMRNSLQDPAARAAQFVAIEGNAVSGICQALLDGDVDLVEGSRQLAQRLYAIIASDRRISPGDFVVCLYQAGNLSRMSRYLGLLKIDPSEAFRPRTERDAQGNLYVSFEIQPDILPTTRERLQKCAFVQSLEPRPEYDMLLLDRQVAPSVERTVARFFAEDFLSCQLALDARQRTHRLYRGLVSAHNQLRSTLSPDEDEGLNQAISAVPGAAEIDIDTWLAGLRLPDVHKERINQVLSQELPDRAFEIDASYATKLIRKRRFVGDHGLRVEVPADKYSQVIKSVEPVEEPGRPSYYRVVIHTEKWEEVSG